MPWRLATWAAVMPGLSDSRTIAIFSRMLRLTRDRSRPLLATLSDLREAPHPTRRQRPLQPRSHHGTYLRIFGLRVTEFDETSRPFGFTRRESRRSKKFGVNPPQCVRGVARPQRRNSP